MNFCHEARKILINICKRNQIFIIRNVSQLQRLTVTGVVCLVTVNDIA